MRDIVHIQGNVPSPLAPKKRGFSGLTPNHRASRRCGESGLVAAHGVFGPTRPLNGYEISYTFRGGCPIPPRPEKAGFFGTHPQSPRFAPLRGKWPRCRSWRFRSYATPERLRGFHARLVRLRPLIPLAFALTALGVLAVGGCQKKDRESSDDSSSKPAGAQARVRPDAVKPRLIPHLIKGPADPAAYLCAEDADCVVSCLRDGRCCPEPCPPCERAYRRDFLARLRRHIARRCVGLSCPDVHCAGGAGEGSVVPRCRRRRCVVERGP